MNYPPKPEHMRPPLDLSDAALRRSLEELDAKIKTLRNRAHATAAHSHHTYHEHIAALEAKRAKLSERLGPARHASSASTGDRNAWEEIWRGIENLREDLRDLI